MPCILMPSGTGCRSYTVYAMYTDQSMCMHVHYDYRHHNVWVRVSVCTLYASDALWSVIDVPLLRIV